VSKRTPTSPTKANHRMMKSLVDSSPNKDKIAPRPEELDLVAKVFQLAGGSWERVFLGSADDVNLLKKTIKIAAEKGVFTKAARW
jgi:hypothetical protein